MQPNDQKEVYFHEYRKQCKYEKTPEKDDPCDECFSNTTNTYSHKPTKFEEKKL